MDIFERYKQETDAVNPPRDAVVSAKRNAAAAAGRRRSFSSPGFRWGALAVCAVMVLAIAVPVFSGVASKGDLTVSSYSELYRALIKANRTGGSLFYSKFFALGSADVNDPVNSGGEPMPEQNSSDHSDTNIQVAGVDEADIVKTDGKYIYYVPLNGMAVKIVEAGEGMPRYLSEIPLESDASELYLCDGRLIVVGMNSPSYDGSLSSDAKSTGLSYGFTGYNYGSAVTVYDISDPEKPLKVASFAQSGRLVSTRLIDGTVYAVSNCYIYNPDESKPESFVPLLADDDGTVPLDCSRIRISRDCAYAHYTVVAAYDVSSEKPVRTSGVARLGGTDSVYCGKDTLYLAESTYSYSLVGESGTVISRIKLGAELEFDGTAKIPGTIVNSYSMDEYNGYFRIVTTLDSYSLNGSTRSNGLYVLDGELKTVGSLEGLAETERVYSVRFDKNIAYFVTFRQVDPLFTVDLTVPSKPELKSALKIPGFSEYLHVWDDGLLFGLGKSADAETGRTECLKLSMFDVSDPLDVSEKDVIKIPDYEWSEASANARAILIEPDRGIVGFPAWNINGSGYLIFRYDAEKGFSLAAELAVNDGIYSSDYALRSVRIGEIVYLCSESGVETFSLGSFEKLGTLKFG